MSLFSVIIPVYNTERYLAECVQSVLKQDFKSLEIILVDDCSTDKSSEICDFFAEKNKNIKVIHQQKNCGVSVSRNTGINAARGQYIIFLDSDDYLIAGSLSGIARLIEEKPETDVIIGKFICKPEAGGAFWNDYDAFNGNIINNGEPDDVIAHIIGLRVYSACWFYIINRNFIVENILYFLPVKIYEDQDFVAKLLCLSRKFAFYDEFFYCYRRRAKSLGSEIDRNAISYCFELVGAMCKFIKENNLSDIKKEFMYSRIKFALGIAAPLLYLYNREEVLGFSKIIEKHIDHFEILENISCGFDLYFFIKTFGPFYGLVLYKAFITEKTVSLLKDMKKTKIFIFCASLFGEVTLRILQNEGYSVKGFLDNNKEKENSRILGLNVDRPSILTRMSEEDIAEVSVVICTQLTSYYEKISSQLKEIGLKKEQIACQIFDNDRLVGLREFSVSDRDEDGLV